MMKKYTEEELKQIFENRSNCYADSDEVVMAMDKERFIETLRELKILPIQNVMQSCDTCKHLSTCRFWQEAPNNGATCKFYIEHVA